MGKKYYGIHCDCHDAGVTILDENGNLEFYAEAERYFPRCKKTGYLNNISEFFPRPGSDDIVCMNYPLVCDNRVYLDRGKLFTEPVNGFNPLLVQRFESGDSKSYFEYFLNYEIKPTFILSHHLCHILSSWAFRANNERRLCISCDGGGAYANGDFSSFLVGFIDEKGVNLCDGAHNIPSSIILDSLLGKQSAGKAMGAAGYFQKQNHISTEQLYHFVRSMFFTKDSNGFIGLPNIPDFQLIGKDKEIETLKTVGIIYDQVIYEIWKSCEINLRRFIPNGDIGLVIGGGTNLSLELNTSISYCVKDLVFGPPISDCGISLGAAIYGFYLDNGRWPDPLKSPSIMYLQKELPEVGPQQPKEIARLLASNSVIGLMRGKAECGPRALGFRSILANAGERENLNRVSEKLKQREYYRPLAPMITSESFDKYFIGPKGQYMQYRCECTEDARRYLPAIVHCDNSSRPQVVYKDSDPWLHELLVEYGRITGHECLINTSLNGPGKPICNTYEDAVEDFANKDIKIVSIKTKN